MVLGLKIPSFLKDLTEATNYSAEDLDKVFSLLNNIDNSLPWKIRELQLKEAEEHYHINALYLLAHSALESDWGRSKIAKIRIISLELQPTIRLLTFLPRHLMMWIKGEF